MSATIEAPSNEHDAAIAEAHADAATEMAEAARDIAETEASAAIEIAETQADVARDLAGELNECQTQLASVTQRLDALAVETAAMRTEHQVMLASLTQSPPETQPENPANPAESEPGEAAEEVPAEPPEEPERPERRRAHRWI